MIDIALKHWIYELCIDQVFEGFHRNFNPAESKIFYTGQKFTEIHYQASTRGGVWVLRDVEVNLFDGKLVHITAVNLMGQTYRESLRVEHIKECIK